MFDVKDLQFRYAGAKEDTIKGNSFSFQKGEIL